MKVLHPFTTRAETCFLQAVETRETPWWWAAVWFTASSGLDLGQTNPLKFTSENDFRWFSSCRCPFLISYKNGMKRHDRQEFGIGPDLDTEVPLLQMKSTQHCFTLVLYRGRKWQHGVHPSYIQSVVETTSQVRRGLRECWWQRVYPAGSPAEATFCGSAWGQIRTQKEPFGDF